MNASIKN